MKAKSAVGIFGVSTLLFIVIAFFGSFFNHEPFFTANILKIVLPQAVLIGLSAIFVTFAFKSKGVIGVFFASALVFIGYTFLSAFLNHEPTFTAENLKTIVRQAAIVGLGAVGMSYVFKAKGVVGVFLAWVMIYVVFVFLIWHFRDKQFLTPDNLELMMRQAVIVGLGAIGMSYVIMTGGIDLSPGSTIALTTVVVALVLKSTNNPWLGIGTSILVGLIAGFINGVLVAKLKVGAFIVTLATMLIFRGVAKGFAHEQTVGSVPSTWIESFTAALGKNETWQIIPKGAWVWLALLIIMTLILNRTVFGRNVVAVGSNEKTARLCGINVNMVKIGVYSIGGLFAGIAGLMQVSRVGIGDPTIAAGDELKMIAAVVIGGGSLLGGEGNLIGAAFGTLIMTTINMGSTQLGIANWIQEIVTGLIIVVAVALDRYRMSRPAKIAAEAA